MSQQAYQRLEPDEAYARLQNNDDVVLVDVREPLELMIEGFIDGATRLPMSFLARKGANDIPQDKPVIVYCAHGHRSERLAAWLAHNGWDDVADVIGGLERWKQAGLPVERGG